MLSGRIMAMFSCLLGLAAVAAAATADFRPPSGGHPKLQDSHLWARRDRAGGRPDLHRLAVPSTLVSRDVRAERRKSERTASDLALAFVVVLKPCGSRKAAFSGSLALSMSLAVSWDRKKEAASTLPATFYFHLRAFAWPRDEPHARRKSVDRPRALADHSRDSPSLARVRRRRALGQRWPARAPLSFLAGWLAGSRGHPFGVRAAIAR